MMMTANARRISGDVWHVGGSDRRSPIFEGHLPVPAGMSYNAYLILGGETALFDTVDKSVASAFIEDVKAALDGRPLNRLVVQHMEPDHTAAISALAELYPDMTVVCTAGAKRMLANYCPGLEQSRVVTVKDRESMKIGDCTVTFLTAPMVHWPEVMVSYLAEEKILFSADAFGTFGALSGNIFADECCTVKEWLPEARRYYANIVGKYGPQVQALLKKAAEADIAVVAPLHGPVWRSDLVDIISAYDKWSRYEPEEKAVTILYTSVYGNTARACGLLADELAARGVKKVKMLDMNVTHPSYGVAEAFRASCVVFASTTYNNGLFPSMRNLLDDMADMGVKDRDAAIIANGSWAPQAGKIMRAKLEEMGGMTFIGEDVTVAGAMNDASRQAVSALADAVAQRVL